MESGDAAGEDWLPPLFLLSDYDGDWQRYVEAVYDAFCWDFVESTPLMSGKRFSLKRHPLLQGKEATFWHITSEGPEEEERTPDLRRCERIRWPRALIESMGSMQVVEWVQERRNKQGVLEKRFAIALPDFSYLVILTDRGDYVLLWTAFCVEYDSQRRKLNAEYQSYKARNG